MTNDELLTHAQRMISTSKDRRVTDLLRRLLNELENSYTFEEFVAAAQRDNQNNLGKGRKLTVWLDAIEKELKNDS